MLGKKWRVAPRACRTVQCIVVLYGWTIAKVEALWTRDLETLAIADGIEALMKSSAKCMLIVD